MRVSEERFTSTIDGNAFRIDEEMVEAEGCRAACHDWNALLPADQQQGTIYIAARRATSEDSREVC